MQSPYIPGKDSLFALWLANFATLIAATPATYGLVVGDATVITAANTAFQAAYTLSTDPLTRTSVTVAAKDAARAAAQATVRPYAVTISRNPAVDNGDKVAVGVNLPNSSRTPIPAPTSFPALSLVSAQPLVHVLAYRDTSTPTSKAKPFGATGVELVRAVGIAPAVDPSAGKPVLNATKSPVQVPQEAGDVGKLATYFARWVTRSGPGGVAQSGPWSAPLTVGII